MRGPAVEVDEPPPAQRGLRSAASSGVAVTSTVRTPVDTAVACAVASRLRRFARKEIGTPPRLSVAIVGDRRMRDLHRRFLHDDSTTDVLSFHEDGAVEVVVCLPQAIRQARQVGEPPGAELMRLMAHGLLHALGFRDDRQPHRRRMWAVQERWVQRLRREVPGWSKLLPGRSPNLEPRTMMTLPPKPNRRTRPNGPK